MRKLFIFRRNFLQKACEFEKLVVPLHPLSLRKWDDSNERKSSLKVLHKTEEVVVQEAEILLVWDFWVEL
jgi:hypothetical protein